MAAQIERRHQRCAQRQHEARRLTELVGAQLEAMRPTCVRCGAKLWLPGRLNAQMQPWCVKVTCDRLPEDAQLSIEYLLSSEVMPEERGVLRGATGDGHQGKHVSSSKA